MVFASLYTQLLEHELTRTLIQDRLALPGPPQMPLQLGVAHATQHRLHDLGLEPVVCMASGTAWLW